MSSKAETQEYLCQVNPNLSCGNCCGLYNVPDASFDLLNRMLTYRTQLFAKTPREMESILAFKDHIREKEPTRRPIADFHHCPFIGLVGDAQSTVGCLLHPAVPGNNGIDFRGLSFYGSMTCNMYFCPSAHNLSAAYAKIVKAFAENWYQYGLIITEMNLLEAFFREIEVRINRPMTLELCRQYPELQPLIVEFFRLKISWPFRSEKRAYISNYYFNDNICPKPEIDYAALNVPVPAYHLLFQELASEFNSINALKSAEKLLDSLLGRICHSVI